MSTSLRDNLLILDNISYTSGYGGQIISSGNLNQSGANIISGPIGCISVWNYSQSGTKTFTGTWAGYYVYETGHNSGDKWACHTGGIGTSFRLSGSYSSNGRVGGGNLHQSFLKSA